jgi:thiamine-phosphate diphosphorylase
MIYPPIQCLTIDGIALSHVEQVRALCGAGAEWIQLRMKDSPDERVEAVARECVSICRVCDCRFIVNDRMEVALRIGADGVHLGKLDMAWGAAREMAGTDFIIGGTVNSIADAKQAVASGVLNYVGVGPYQFTRTKQNLAPVLRREEWAAILFELGDLPSSAIGGIDAQQLPAVQQLGVTGVALSSCLYRNELIAENYHRLLALWSREPSYQKV